MADSEQLTTERRRYRVRIGVRVLACASLALASAHLWKTRTGSGSIAPSALYADAAAWFCALAIALGLASAEARAAQLGGRAIAGLTLASLGLAVALDRGAVAPIAALGLALLSTSILISGRRANRSQIFALAAGVLGAVALLGYLSGIPLLYHLPVAGELSFFTALLLTSTAAAALFLEPGSGIPSALMDGSEAGRQLRRLAAAGLLSALIGWLALGGTPGRELGYGAALFAIACIVAPLAIASWAYASLRRAELERGRARLELAASEARYRRTFDHARIGIARLSPDGHWLQVNQRLVEILGYDESELLARTYADVSHLEDLDIDVKQWELLRRGEISDYAVERRFQAKNGEVIHSDVRIAREEDDSGKLQHVVLVLQDITARKLSDGTRRVYERALVATQNGVVITDARRDDQPIVYANPAFSNITGYASSELIGKNCRILNEKARDQAALDDLRSSIASGSNCSVLVRNHKKNGEAFWNQLSIAPIEDAAGRLTHFVGVMTDVTERVRVIAEREELLSAAQSARNDAEAANRAKDRFLSVISHELRSPLNAILAWTSLLRDEPGEEVAKVVRAIEASVHSQSRLVNELLDASRIREGTMQIEPVLMDLEAVVRSALARLAPIASERGIALEFAGSGPAPVIADPERVEQVVRNLVDNALKFTPAEGHVDVTLSEGEGRWIIEVRDDGRGISADALPHVFQEFWQGDRETSGHSTGLGLGLLIVKHLVERHAGSVRIDSEGRNRGTCVRVELPATREPLASSPATRKENNLKGIEVVVVDDDESVVHAVGVALARAGAICRPATSAPEALRYFDRGTPDALVSDIGLPDRDGFDLIRSLRASDEPNRSVLAIAVTGLVEPEERRRIHRAGFDAYIPKPVVPDVVTKRLATLRAQQAERQPPKRRVLLLGADVETTRCAEQLERAGHVVVRVHGATDAMDAATAFRPHLVIARTCELDAATLADRLASHGICSGVVGLGDDDLASDQNGFQLIIPLEFTLDAIDRSLRFLEDA